MQGFEGNRPIAVDTTDVDLGIESHERLRKVAWIGRDAVFSHAKHGVQAVVPASAAHPEPGLRLLHAS